MATENLRGKVKTFIFREIHNIRNSAYSYQAIFNIANTNEQSDGGKYRNQIQNLEIILKTKQNHIDLGLRIQKT